jgi:hypothetical protein
MDWESIISLIIALLVVIAFPLALRRRKKASAQKREELYQHLKEIGVKASLVEEGSDKEKIGLSRTSGQKSEGIIALQDKNIESIHIISVASQYGTNYFLDYLVKSSNITANRILKKTRLTVKKSLFLWGKVVAMEWKGDKSLAQSLNFDYRLKDILLQRDVTGLKGSIGIFPEPKHGYTRIRTHHSLPSPEIFEALDIVAKHIKSW